MPPPVFVIRHVPQALPLDQKNVPALAANVIACSTPEYWNPLSATVAACRDLFGNPGATQSTAWPLQHPELASLGWSVLLLLIFVPLTIRRYRALS